MAVLYSIRDGILIRRYNITNGKALHKKAKSFTQYKEVKKNEKNN